MKHWNLYWNNLSGNLLAKLVEFLQQTTAMIVNVARNIHKKTQTEN